MVVFPFPAAVTALVLYVLLIFGAVSAAIGAFLAIALDGGGFPLDLLDGTPFTSAFWPGVILGAVVGGTQGLAALLVQRRHPAALLAAAVAGFGMTIWIFTEVAMIDGFSPLQAFYFALGLAEVCAVLALLGVRPSLASRDALLQSRRAGTSDPRAGDSRA
jgi:hypothetical protein